MPIPSVGSCMLYLLSTFLNKDDQLYSNTKANEHCCMHTVESVIKNCNGIKLVPNKMPAKLYKSNFSPPARTAMMACEVFNVPVEMIDLDLMQRQQYSPEFLKINPLHTIPVFVDGDLVIHDSHAILMYLAEVYGNDSPLYPKDIKQRTLINQKLFFHHGVLFMRMRNISYPAMTAGVREVTQKQLDDLQEAYDFMEEFLTRHKFLALDHITIADIVAYATACLFKYVIPVDANKYPKFTAWLNEMEKQPYCQKHNVAGAKVFGDILQALIDLK